ncbi:HNH endonuclease [Clostridium ganghwense]|uniref:HNH endonuclease n=1 Tax=Clostridium ganghwense TaxID=312089 RepID=A0ABT4CXE0_9CLOT|nr:HNH endonuclease [Clostridium ganghwense]MCY6372554.1 HNH endonuclease [Clostridium ganghwense]
MKNCVLCGKLGEKHHIVYKSQGGLDIPLNYIYLCFEHHRGINGPHKNRYVDKEYKLNLQEELIRLLKKDYYDIEELKKILNINPYQAKIVQINLNKYKLGYKKIEVIKRIMGGKIYVKK